MIPIAGSPTFFPEVFQAPGRSFVLPVIEQRFYCSSRAAAWLRLKSFVPTGSTLYSGKRLNK